MKRIRSALATQPAAPRIESPEQVRVEYRRWRIRMMLSMLGGYAAFYLVRKNFSMAMPAFLGELGYTKTDLGLVLSAFSVIYGLGKLLNGMLADRANPRYFMAIGLMGSAVANICFGLSTGLGVLAAFWLVNAWFQSMGWPPCARMLTHWYGASERGTMWGLWNASHQIGGAIILIMAGALVTHLGWRWAFHVPAAIAVFAALVLAHFLRDTPVSLGLPPIEEYRNEVVVVDSAPQMGFWPALRAHILSNRLIWFVCTANFFVYIVRIGLLDWAPTFLVEAKGSSLAKAGWQVAGYEIAGILGAIVAGVISDRVFKGKRGVTGGMFMVALIGFLFLFWKMPPGHEWLDGLALVAVGFFVYGPQMLVGVAAADVVSPSAVATATGLTGTFGYLGSTVCGLGTGLIVDTWGWDGGFVFFIAAAVMGAVFFLFSDRGR